jgi:hypothetical protein
MASENGQEKRETLADIVEKMVRESIIHVSIPTTYLKSYADSINAAWRREKAEIEADALAVGGIVEAARHKPGNAAEMREALVFLRDKELSLLEGNVRHCVGLTVFGLEQTCKIMRGVIEDALSEPPRNCDVGTALEQAGRFMDFCRPSNRPSNCGKCKVCPKGMNKFWCQLEWAQTPYEVQEGAADGK